MVRRVSAVGLGILLLWAVTWASWRSLLGVVMAQERHGDNTESSNGVWITALTPKPLDEHVKKGLEWLVKHQHPSGGWGSGEEAVNALGDPSARDNLDITDTCVAALALIRSGNTLESGPYKDALARAVEFVLAKVESSDDESLAISEVKVTRIQLDLGMDIDAYMASLLLAEVKGLMQGNQAGERVELALTKVFRKILRHQNRDGTWRKGLGFTPVLSEAVYGKALNRAAQAGLEVPEGALAWTENFAMTDGEIMQGAVSLHIGGLGTDKTFQAVARNPRRYQAIWTGPSILDIERQARLNSHAAFRPMGQASPTISTGKRTGTVASTRVSSESYARRPSSDTGLNMAAPEESRAESDSAKRSLSESPLSEVALRSERKTGPLAVATTARNVAADTDNQSPLPGIARKSEKRFALERRIPSSGADGYSALASPPAKETHAGTHKPQTANGGPLEEAGNPIGAGGQTPPRSGGGIVLDADTNAIVRFVGRTSSLSVMRDWLNTHAAKERKLRQEFESATTTRDRNRAKQDLSRYENTRKAHGELQRILLEVLDEPTFAATFGVKGGEDFLCYMMISESLMLDGGADWKRWDETLSKNLKRVQNFDGSWVGHHCISGRTFCTSMALLTLMADRAPVPPAVKTYVRDHHPTD